MSSIGHNQFESLSNELLLEVFEYLDACNLYQAFHGLNHRFNTLLQAAQLYVVLASSGKNQPEWNTLLSFFNSSQVYALSFATNVNDITKRFLSFAQPNLYFLSLYNINEKLLGELFTCLPKNNRVKLLCVSDTYYYGEKNRSVFDLIFVDYAQQLTSLTDLSISVSTYKEFPIVSTVFSQLRHLSINQCQCSSNFLQFLQDCTPNLQSLQVSGYIYMNSVISNVAIKHIRELNIAYGGDENNLATILSLFPCLRRLHIDCLNSQRSQFIDGERWRTLIETYIADLKQLTIEFDQGIDQQIVKTFYVGDFWSTKKVSVKTLTNRQQFRCPVVKTIYFGRKWHFGYFDKLAINNKFTSKYEMYWTLTIV